MYFDEFLDRYPDVLRLRPDVSFPRDTAPATAQAAFESNGVVQLRDALPKEVITRVREGVEALETRMAARFDGGERTREVTAFRDGMGSNLWSLVNDGRHVFADFIPALLRSWAWPVVEALCGSRSIVVLVSICYMRRIADRPLGVGAHQDAFGFETELPVSIWIPLHPIVPRVRSGLGFVLHSDRVVLPHTAGDIGGDYVLAHHRDVWLPEYQPGDLTVHGMFTPHFTTGFGTGELRYSIEVRCLAQERAPVYLQDPAVLVQRSMFARHASIVAMRVSPGHEGSDFMRAMCGGDMRRY